MQKFDTWVPYLKHTHVDHLPPRIHTSFFSSTLQASSQEYTGHVFPTLYECSDVASLSPLFFAFFAFEGRSLSYFSSIWLEYC